MSELKKIIQRNIVNPAVQPDLQANTLGIVTQSDKASNTCSIRYTDKDGYVRSKDNVKVRICYTATDPLPKKNDVVEINDTGDTVAIIGKYVGDYAAEVRSKRQLRQDVMSDQSACCPPGCGSIM